jgi:hypothetical protein
MSQDEGCKCKDGAGECGCHGECDCGCGCGGGGHLLQRRFRTKAEQIEELDAYLADLKLEVQAVEEQLADLHR